MFSIQKHTTVITIPKDSHYHRSFPLIASCIHHDHHHYWKVTVTFPSLSRPRCPNHYRHRHPHHYNHHVATSPPPSSSSLTFPSRRLSLGPLGAPSRHAQGILRAPLLLEGWQHRPFDTGATGTHESTARRRPLALLAGLLACLPAVTSFAEWSSRSWLSALDGSIWKQWLSCLFLYPRFSPLSSEI